MPAVDFDAMPGDARLWVFAAPRPLTDDEAARVEAEVDAFLAGWNAHGHPVVGARALLHGRFLLVAADERATGVSGCSIDSLFRALARLQGAVGASLLDGAGHVFYRDRAGEVAAAPRAEFRRLAREGAVDGATVVFDNTVDTVGALRAGRWETAMRDAWHAKAFPVGAPA